MEDNKTSNQTPEEIRAQISQTRAELAEKTDALKCKLSNTVDDAKDMVRERIENVKRTFSLSHQVGQHPWQAMAVAMSLGFVLQKIISGNRSSQSGQPDRSSLGRERDSELERQSRPYRADNVLARLASEHGEEVRQIKNVAIGWGIGLLREFIKNRLATSLPVTLDTSLKAAATRQAPQLGTHNQFHRTASM